MDTHVAATHPDLEPAIEPFTAGISARLPGEAREKSSVIGGFEAGERPPSSTAKSAWRLRGALLAGVGAAAIMIAGGVFLVSPYNRVYRVTRPQASVNSVADAAAHDAQGTPRPILAPSASLAKVVVPPAPPATHAPYVPKSHDEQVAEMLSLRPGPTAELPPSNAAVEHDYAARDGAVLAPARAESGAPPGYVPREPGSATVAQAPALASAAPASSPEPPGPPPAAPAVVRPRDTTAVVIASLPQAQQAVRDNPVAPQTPPALPVAPQAGEAPASGEASPAMPASSPKPDVVAVATNLRAGPMTPPEQVQVLNLVTEVAALVKDLRKQQAQLRSDLAKSSADVTSRLTDYERRVAFAEARTGVTAAEDATGDASDNAPGAPARDSASISSKAIQVVATRPIAATPTPAPGPTGPAKVYRVQAASPGLALLAQVDRGGGDGAQIQVVVGDTVPDYGRVKSIGQKGTAWVVTTEHGAIQ